MVIWVSVRDMLPLITLIEPQTNSVDIFMAYTKSDVKSDLFMEPPIGFEVKGDHPREWLIIPEKNLYGLKDAGLA